LAWFELKLSFECGSSSGFATTTGVIPTVCKPATLPKHLPVYFFTKKGCNVSYASSQHELYRIKY